MKNYKEIKMHIQFKTLFLFVLLYCSGFAAQSQTDSVELYSCLRAAKESFTLNQNKANYSASSELELKNASNNWLPSLTLDASATYQSESMSVEPGPSLPFPLEFSAPKDNIKVVANIQQTIYDGGITKSQKELIATNLNISTTSTDIQTNNYIENIVHLYYGILSYQKNIALIEANIESLKEKKNQLRSSIANGLLTPTDSLQLETGIVKLQVSLKEAKLSHANLISTLNNYTGKSYSSNTIFAFPQDALSAANNYSTPEIELIALQQNKIEISQDIIKASTRPKVYAFSQLGYGKPGLNYLSDEFSPYYIVGGGVSWTIWDWKESKNKREMLSYKKMNLDNQANWMNQNIDILIEKENTEILKLEESIKEYQKILDMQKRITENAQTKLDLGTISMTEYILLQNEELKTTLLLENLIIQKSKAYILQSFYSGQLYKEINSK